MLNEEYQVMTTEDGKIPHSVKMSGVMSITKKKAPNDPVLEEGGEENELLSGENDTKKLNDDLEVELEVKSKKIKKKTFSGDELV